MKLTAKNAKFLNLNHAFLGVLGGSKEYRE
jgi:hypothetical protein